MRTWKGSLNRWNSSRCLNRPVRTERAYVADDRSPDLWDRLGSSEDAGTRAEFATLAIFDTKKRGSREQPSPPCHRVTKPVKASTFRRPPNRLSRRSREHRPTIGALEPPQVTPMCLLGGQPLAQRRPSIEQRVIPTGERAKALLPTGTAVKMVSRTLIGVEYVRPIPVRNLLGCCR